VSYLNGINDDVKMIIRRINVHPVKTGYFQKFKKSWKKGREEEAAW
jgi:hypothetical protein